MSKPTKQDLIEALAASDRNLSKAAAGRHIEFICDWIIDHVRAGDPVTLSGVGTFSTVDVPARTARDPRNGNIVDVPAGRRIKFHAAKAFKDSVNK